MADAKTVEKAPKKSTKVVKGAEIEKNVVKKTRATKKETEVAKVPETEVAEVPETEVAEVPETEVAEVPETEVAEVPETEVAEVASEQPEVIVAEVPDAEVDVSLTSIEESAQDDQDKEDVSTEGYEFPVGFRPILRPTAVAGKPLGYIACPRAVFEAVTNPGWREGIEDSKIRLQLLSVLYWMDKNGSAKVRCQSSSRFSEAV